MKLVVNKCHGGFGLSEEAVKAYAERKGLTLYPEADPRFSSLKLITYYLVPPEQRVRQINWAEASMEERKAYNERYSSERLYDRDIPRDDADLIAVVEQLGAQANGRCAALEIVEVPDGVDWQIDEYDGSEWVAEKHRTW